MPTINIPVSYHRVRGGGFICDLGSDQVFAVTKELLKAKVAEAIQQAFNGVEIAVVRDGDDLRVGVLERDKYSTYYVDGSENGRLRIRSTGASWLTDGETFDQMVDRELLQIAQTNWQHGDDMPPYVPASKVDDFKSWRRFQEAYKLAKECGMTDGAAHQAACGLS